MSRRKQIIGRIYYVYTLSDPRNDAVFYVGKGTGNRPQVHAVEASQGCECKKCQRMREIWSGGVDIRVDYVYETEFERDALIYEKQLIAEIGLKNLCNVYPGGISTPVLEWGNEAEYVDAAFTAYAMKQLHLEQMEKRLERGELVGRSAVIWRKKIEKAKRSRPKQKSWVEKID